MFNIDQLKKCTFRNEKYQELTNYLKDISTKITSTMETTANRQRIKNEPNENNMRSIEKLIVLEEIYNENGIYNSKSIGGMSKDQSSTSMDFK